jgi:hypothetical protein
MRPPEQTEKKEQRNASRAERADAAIRQSRRDKTRRLLVGGSSLGIVVALVGGYLIYNHRANAALQTKLTAGGICSTDEKTDPTGPPGQNHVPSPSYAVDPPAGGNHTAEVAKAGELRGDAAKNLGPIVHALEHGYVVLWYRPDLPDSQRKVLTDLASQRSGDILVVEHAAMSVPVAATAWGERLLCTKAAAASLDAFAGKYIGKGPENPARG